jgi:hypothetical protein
LLSLDPVVATHVSATIFVHKGLAIKTESLDDEEKSVDVRDIGNVTKETGITFEYSKHFIFFFPQFTLVHQSITL